MFQVNLTNPSQNLSWSGIFSSEQEAQNWLSQQIGKPHRLPERTVPIDSEYSQEDVLEVIQEEDIEGQLQDVSVRLKAQFTVEILDISAQVAQQELNAQSRKLLQDTDYLVIRHIGQKALNLETSLTEQEYLALEQQRQEARESILEE